MAEIIEILEKIRAINQEGHFVYTSGRHGVVYINKDALSAHPEIASQVGLTVAQQFLDQDIEVVAAPALGSIVLGHWTAYHLGRIEKREVLSVFTEKTANGNQALRRGYGQIVVNKRTLVAEDVLTTGESAAKTVRTVKAAGGLVIAVCALINRDPERVTADTIGAPLTSMGILQAESFSSQDCPLCRRGVPINTTLGHGELGN